MSYLKLNPDVREYVKTETAAEIPDPNSPAFEPFLADLKETRPELAEALVQGLEVEGAELPEEVQARRAGRREGRRSFVHRLFFSRSYEGNPNLNKRKTLFVIVAVLMAALPFAFLVDQLAARRAAAREASLAAAVVGKSPVVSAAPPLKEQSPQIDGAVAEPADLPSPPSNPVVNDDLPPPPGPVNPSVADAPPNVASSPSSVLAVVESPTTTIGQSQELSVFSGQTSPPNVLSVSTSVTAPEQLDLGAAQDDASLISGTQGTTLDLITNVLPESAPSLTLTVFSTSKGH